MQEKKVRKRTNEKDALKVVKEFEEIIKNNKRDNIWLAHHQSQIFLQNFAQKFKEKEPFVRMVLKLKIKRK